jgi:hypothetical protein
MIMLTDINMFQYMRRLRRFFATIVSVSVLALCALPAHANTAAKVVSNTLAQDYPSALTFKLDLKQAANISDIALVFGSDNRNCNATSARRVIDFDAGESIKTSWEWELKDTATMAPGTAIWWRWEMTDSAGRISSTDTQTTTVRDNRYKWKSLSNGSLTLNWASGKNDFGRDLMVLAQQSLRKATRDYGITQTSRIDIWVYPDFEALRDTLHFESEWVGGVALPWSNAVLTAIEATDDIDWARDVIPHELTHVIVGERMFNCVGGGLPTWLNEGLAVFSEPDQGKLNNLDGLKRILEDRKIVSLRSQSGQFAADRTLASAAYAYGGFVVKYMVETGGPQKLSAMLDRVRAGATIDEALTAAYGLDTDGLDAAWRKSVGIKTPPLAQPTAAPARKTKRTPVPTLAPINPNATPSP